MDTTDYIAGTEAESLPGLFSCRVGRTPESIAYQQFDAASAAWKSYTWEQVARQVVRWRQALSDAHLARGDRVALMLRNSVEWVIFDQAALSLGLVVVPLYTQDNPGNIGFVIGDSGSRLLLVGKAEQWQRLACHRDLFPTLEMVIAIDGKPAEVQGVCAHRAASWLPEAGDIGVARLSPDDLATIVYTSGTTGRPKGVMLSHRNILSNVEGISRIVPCFRDDVFLSFLPLSHMLERTAGYYYPMMAGSQVVYARSIETLTSDLQTIRPTVLISVPRMFERAYARIDDQLRRKSGLARRLFVLAEKIGWEHFEWSQRRVPRPAWLRRTAWPVLNAVVGKQIRQRLGGRLRLTVSGGGRLDERVARRFLGLDLVLLQGYGLTEASPVVTGNRQDDNLPESVGFPLPGVEVRIGEGGELLVRGENVMQGYWGRPEATAQAIDAEGWLHTGDVAQLVDGRVFIRGRIKDIVVTSTGEKVPTADVEAAIGRDPLVQQVLILGEGKPFLAALLVLQIQEWERFAAEIGVNARGGDALALPKVRQVVLQRINAQLSDFPSYARVRAVHLLTEPWTIENGLMTPTQKLKRGHIIARFAEPVGALYAGHGFGASPSSPGPSDVLPGERPTRQDEK